jgi:uncharacterized protein YacL
MHLRDTHDSRLSIWAQWVLANGIAECVGLGLTFGAGVVIFIVFGEPRHTWEALAFGLLMVITGVIEGSIVGIFQWRVIRKLLPIINWKSWLVATLIGALTAWLLGSIPSTLASMQPDQQAEMVEPQLAVMLLLAAAMGAVLGLVLAFPQSHVLRKYTSNAWIWLPANSLAWLAGLPIIFAAVDLVFKQNSTVFAVLLFFSALALTGAVVGAIHGLALVRLRIAR